VTHRFDNDRVFAEQSFFINENKINTLAAAANVEEMMREV
jgi:hypothetical protein